MRAIRKLARLLGILVAVAMVAALGLIGYLTVNEYRPQDIEAVQ